MGKGMSQRMRSVADMYEGSDRMVAQSKRELKVEHEAAAGIAAVQFEIGAEVCRRLDRIIELLEKERGS